MDYLNEYKQFFSIGDIVLIEYWYNGMMTPVEVIKRQKNKYLVSHNNKFSKIKNAPDELIKSADILDKFNHYNDSIK